jgi:DNA polymerase-3 subunit epsilon
VDDGAMDSYLEVLDRVLLDRLVSDTEADRLVELAAHLSLDRASLEDAHRRYVSALATAAWEDLIVTPAERQDLLGVATLLGLPGSAVDEAISATKPELRSGTKAQVAIDRFALRLGDSVVLTGEMTVPREVWERRIVEHGLTCGAGVTKKTALLVAADPDSLSGKARKANDYGIPIVTEQAFAELITGLGAI